MAISSVGLKGLLGFGVASTVAIGGIYLYNRSTKNVEKNIDYLALEIFSLKWTASTEQDTVSVIIKGQDEKNGEITALWQCKITGKRGTGEGDNSKELKIVNQIKESLGIQDNKTIKKEKEVGFKKFVENCIRYRSTPAEAKSSNSSIDLGELETDSKDQKYKFKETELKKLLTQDLFNEKLKDEIFIPEECLLDLGNKSHKECTLDNGKLQKINFENKPNGNLTVTNNQNTNLRIEKTKEIDIFPNGLKFIITTDKSLEIKGSDENQKIVLKVGDTEFKVTTQNNKYAIKKAWDTETLANKVNLNCKNNVEKTCSLKTRDNPTTNVYKGENNYLIGVKFSGNLNFEENIDGYNKGLKLTVSGESNIALKKNEKNTNESLIKNGKSYEIGIKKIKGKDAWFIIEK